MFSKTDKKRKSATVRPAAAAAPPSILGSNLTIVGNLKTDGEVQIDGQIDGDIVCGKLTVGERATINGEIAAQSVMIRGSINGRVHAGEVQIAKSAKVYGDIFHETLSIEAGAYLEGHCKRQSPSPQDEPAYVSNTDRAGAAEQRVQKIVQARASA